MWRLLFRIVLTHGRWHGKLAISYLVSKSAHTSPNRLLDNLETKGSWVSHCSLWRELLKLLGEVRRTGMSFLGHLGGSPSLAYRRYEEARGLEERWESKCCREVAEAGYGPLKEEEELGDGELFAREHTWSWWGFGERGHALPNVGAIRGKPAVDGRVGQWTGSSCSTLRGVPGVSCSTGDQQNRRLKAQG